MIEGASISYDYFFILFQYVIKTRMDLGCKVSFWLCRHKAWKSVC